MSEFKNKGCFFCHFREGFECVKHSGRPTLIDELLDEDELLGKQEILDNGALLRVQPYGYKCPNFRLKKEEVDFT